MSLSVWAADSCTRMRACPWGTTGNEKATAYDTGVPQPLRDGACLDCITEHHRDDGVFPWEQVEAGLGHSLAKPRALRSSLLRRSSESCSRSSTASVAPTTAGATEFEKR